MKRSTVAVLALAAAAITVVFTSAALATNKPTREQEALMQRERDNAQAWLKKDAKAVAAWDADDYVYTSFDGSISDKAGDLATLKAGTSNFTTVDVDDMRAMVFRDTGVVVGRYTMKGTYAGSDMSGVFRFTDTYVKRDGRWQCVASQITRIEKP